MAVLNSVMLLDTTAAVIALVDELLIQGALPRKAAADAAQTPPPGSIVRIIW